MSPILEISLTIVFCLWVIPLTWAVATAVRSLPGFATALVRRTVNAPAYVLAYIKLLPSRYERYIENRQQSLENAALESVYLRLQDELIVQRQVVAHASATKVELESKVKKLTEEMHELQSKSNQFSATQEEKERVAKNLESLLKLEGDLAFHQLKLQNLRSELEEKEAAVQLAYSSKQVKIATNTADVACKNLKRLLTSDPTAAVIRRMEEKVVKREAQAYAIYFLEDHYVSFPSVAKAIDRLSIDRFELEELQELFEVLDQAASELHLIVSAAISYEKILQMQFATSDEDVRHWAALVEKAEKEGKERDVIEARKRHEEYAKSAREFQIMQDSSKICSAEFTQMHANFAQKEREIFSRIAELERHEEKDSDNLEKYGDMKFGE